MKVEYDVPDGVEFKKDGEFLVVKGSKGEIKKPFMHPKINVSVKGNKIEISSNSDRRKVNAILYTWKSVINNMAIGVTKGYEAEVKLVHSHFPAKLELKDNKIVIQNFLGQRKSRSAKIPEGVEVKIDKNTIKITGIDKELVGQAGSRIENSTSVKKFDRRIFQDGCYMVKLATPVGD